MNNLKPGHVILTHFSGNKFTVSKLAGKGGMGIVYIAQREKDQREYALKTMKISKVSEAFMANFARECYIWITLAKHPHIVQAHWYELDDDYTPYLIMEYVPDETLRQWIECRRDQHSQKDQTDAIRFVIEALTGLVYARDTVRREWGTPFVHCDIKPANLLLTQTGRVKVSDFGLAKTTHDFRQGGGTPPYMSPEQWEGREVEEKTDVYALGCVLFELLAGRLPFRSAGLNKQRWREIHFSEPPQHLSAEPPELNLWIQRCLAKNPGERPGFEELREGLQRVYEQRTGQRVAVKDEPEPLEAEDWNQRGCGFDLLGRHEQAIACFDEAIRLNSREARFFLDRGTARMRLKEFDAAIQDFERALELDSGLIEAHNNLAAAYAWKGEFERALEIYDRGEKINPQEARLICGRGIALAMMGQPDRAEQEFRKAIEISGGKLAEAYYNWGLLLYRQGNTRAARAKFKQALKIYQFYEQAREALSRLESR